MGSMEGAVCAPSRCMMQTGRSLFHLPPTNLRKSYPEFAAAMKDKTEGADWALLPRVMRANGYATFHIGKRGNECVPSLDSYDLDITHNDPKPEERARSSQVHADGVIDYLRNRKTDKPFFIYLAPPVPHDPRVAAPESEDLVNNLREQGKDIELLIFEDEGHDVLKYKNRVTCYNAITDFFTKILTP